MSHKNGNYLEIELRFIRNLLVKASIVLFDLLLFFKKHFLIVLVFVLIGGLWGGYVSTKRRIVYETSVIATSNSFDQALVIDLINGIRYINNRGDRQALMHELSISEKEVNSILSISARTLYMKDTVSNVISRIKLNRFKIKLICNADSVSNSIVNSLTKYICLNPFLMEEERYLSIKQDSTNLDTTRAMDGQVLPSKYKTFLPERRQIEGGKYISIIEQYTVRINPPSAFSIVKRYMQKGLLFSFLILTGLKFYLFRMTKKTSN